MELGYQPAPCGHTGIVSLHTYIKLFHEPRGRRLSPLPIIKLFQKKLSIIHNYPLMILPCAMYRISHHPGEHWLLLLDFTDCGISDLPCWAVGWGKASFVNSIVKQECKRAEPSQFWNKVFELIGTIKEDRVQHSDVTHLYGLLLVTFAKDKSILSRYCIYYFFLCRKGQLIFMYVPVLTLLFSDTELLKPGNKRK